MRVPIQLHLCKCSRMALDRLTDFSILTIQLHRALHLKCRRIRRIPRDSNKNKPFLVRSDAVVDDLGTNERGMSVEHFLRLGSCIGDRPVEDGGFGDNANRCFGHPFPEHDILIVDVGLDLLLGFNIEYLQRPLGYTEKDINL